MPGNELGARRFVRIVLGALTALKLYHFIANPETETLLPQQPLRNVERSHALALDCTVQFAWLSESETQPFTEFD